MMSIFVCHSKVLAVHPSQHVLHSHNSGYMMNVARVRAQNCCSFYFCVFLWPHCHTSCQTSRGCLIFRVSFTCFGMLTSAASITHCCTRSVKCYNKAHTATYAAESSWKATWLKWKTLGAFGQWYIFHCMQQLTFPSQPQQKYWASTVHFWEWTEFWHVV